MPDPSRGATVQRTILEINSKNIKYEKVHRAIRYCSL